VLTSSTGGGHDARAKAFSQWVHELYGQDVLVRVEKMLENSSRMARFGVNFYNFIQRHAPWLHNPYYLLIEGLSVLNKNNISMGRRYYSDVVMNYRPHLIFSVHDCLNRGYFQVARKILGENNVRCATYCSEFSGGYGYSANWVEPSVDLYLCRTESAREYAVNKLKLDPDRIEVRGQFLMPHVYREQLTPEERKRFITEHLGLMADKQTVLITTGGAGANNHLAILDVLRKFSNHFQAVVICGTNKKTSIQVHEWQKNNSRFKCYITGYTDEIHLYMQVADVVITRGGTTTCAEALHFSCPIVFNAFGGIMPQEQLTVNFFTQANAAMKISRPDELQTILDDWCRSPGHLPDLKRNISKIRFKDNPEDTIRLLVNLAGEAATSSINNPPYHTGTSD
jgi:processive 1,2-diacylglycerol beta-glucosyltransferase